MTTTVLPLIRALLVLDTCEKYLKVFWNHLIIYFLKIDFKEIPAGT